MFQFAIFSTWNLLHSGIFFVKVKSKCSGLQFSLWKVCCILDYFLWGWSQIIKRVKLEIIFICRGEDIKVGVENKICYDLTL
jgi:hypothetical protein